jgi:hypothetical protein
MMRAYQRATIGCALLSSSALMSACARTSELPQAIQPAPIAVVVRAPVEEPSIDGSREAGVTNIALAHSEEPQTNDGPPDPPLPPAWATLPAPTLAFADAIKNARDTRRLIISLSVPRARGDASDAPSDASRDWFSRTSLLAERADRFYSAAFVAVDAQAEDKVDAIFEAAQLTSTIATRFAEAGVAVLPQTWKTDPRVHASFEDVDVGPGRRFHEAAQALAAHCVSAATESDVHTSASNSCKALLATDPAKVPTHVTSRAGAHVSTRDAGSGSACACVPGDPLCTGSAWCGP